MTNTGIYKDIAERTGGDIYIGVVGPVRSGKSTFIKRFMETLVLPNIESDYERTRANDELPQSASGRTIMTTEPKFIPENGTEITLDENVNFKVRMIDCVGYIVPSSIGYIENEQPRMVMTPWFDEPVPFNMAAEIGTQKVINEHSTVGLLVTTDGSISDIPRSEYEEAEERVVTELKSINKPFVILLNCTEPTSESSQTLARQLSAKYATPVLPISCLELSEEQIKSIIATILYEFPVREIAINMPHWINTLSCDHWLKSAICEKVLDCCKNISKIRDIPLLLSGTEECEYISGATVMSVQLGSGSAEVKLQLADELFYKILTENSGIEITDDEQLMKCVTELAVIKKKYERFSNAIDEVEATGYGIVMPTLEELTLQEPEIMKQGGRYGVRLKASAPSIHMMKANITTEVNPIVGSEKQSEDLVMYMLKEFEEDPIKIWQSNIFGKSLNELVNEGLHTKLARMPIDARVRLQETLERLINEGCSGLICIIL